MVLGAARILRLDASGVLPSECGTLLFGAALIGNVLCRAGETYRPPVRAEYDVSLGGNNAQAAVGANSPMLERHALAAAEGVGHVLTHALHVVGVYPRESRRSWR